MPNTNSPVHKSSKLSSDFAEAQPGAILARLKQVEERLANLETEFNNLKTSMGAKNARSKGSKKGTNASED